MDQAVPDHEHQQHHGENYRPSARVHHGPSVKRDLHVRTQPQQKEDQYKTHRAPGDIEAVRKGQQDGHAQSEVAEKVGQD